jgi:hypothetical protein
MKTLKLILVISLFSIVIYGQNQLMPSFYLNGKKIDIEKVHINPQMMDSILVQKDTDGGKNVFISSKSKSMKFYTLNDIIKGYTKLSNHEGGLLFKIDTTYIIDTIGVLIDKSFFIYVNSFNILNASYLSNKCYDLTIVEIALLDKERETQIRIRGEEFINKKEN